MEYQEAWTLIGGLGQTTKMPFFSYGLPASACKTGRKLALLEDSPCHHCYALKGNYLYSVVTNAHAKRLASLDSPQWVEAFIAVLSKHSKSKPFFRWHDSGDIQSFDHLLKIFAIAYALPDMKFWLPTQERGIISLLFKLKISIPENLTIRVSATKLNLGEELAAFGLPISSVKTEGKKKAKGAFVCPAPKQGGQCGTCRACWDKGHKWTVYAQH